jgi:soluble lytic murein transglycosylase-like protein
LFKCDTRKEKPMDALKPVSHYKRKKKVNLSTAIIAVTAVVMLSIFAVLVTYIFFQHRYEQKIKDFMSGEFSMYKTHYKKLTFDIYIESRKAAWREKQPLEEILAYFHNESGFNRYAVSPSGACGVGQLMPAIQKKYGVKNPFNIKENIPASVKFFVYCKSRAHGDVHLAYKKYNGGPNRERFPPGGESEIYGKLCMKDLILTTVMMNRFKILYIVS